MIDLMDKELELLKSFKVGPGFINITDRQSPFSTDIFESLHDKGFLLSEASLHLNGGVVH